MRRSFALMVGLWVGWALAGGFLRAVEESPTEDDHSPVALWLADYAESQSVPAEPPIAPTPPGDTMAQPSPPETALSRLGPALGPRRGRWANLPSDRRIGNYRLTSLLADAPAMLSHFYYPGGMYLLTSTYSGDLPLAAGGRLSVADNNRALTQDRVWFAYNHYHNAVQRSTYSYQENTSVDDPASLDRFTIAAEKTLLHGLWSVEVRMPFANSPAFVSSEFGEFSVVGGDVGNLSVILKRMLWVSDVGSVAAGVGVETPTGSSVRISEDLDRGFVNLAYSIHNQAVYLVPYVGMLLAPDNGVFLQGFLQLNTPANGNPVDFEFSDMNGNYSSERVGVLTPPTLLHADVASGLWLFRSECSDCDSRYGVAAVVEFHYVTALSGIDDMEEFYGAPLRTSALPELRLKREVMDLTVGLHTQFSTSLIGRVGAALPLLNADRRLMDSEVIVQLERRF